MRTIQPNTFYNEVDELLHLGFILRTSSQMSACMYINSFSSKMFTCTTKNMYDMFCAILLFELLNLLVQTFVGDNQ